MTTPSTSTTPSSNDASMSQRILGGIRRLAPVALWSLLWLAVIDIAIGLAFSVPRAVQKAPGKLPSYFEFGRSIEGKIRRSFAPDGSRTKRVTSGWLGPDQQDNPAPPKHAKKDDPRPTVSIYGMSYARNMRDQLKSIEGLNLRFWGGPGASPNHTYTAYLNDRGRHESDVVVFAIVTDAVRGVLSTAGATKGADGWTFMYPRYSIADGELQATEVLCNDLACFEEMLESPQRWEQWRTLLSEHDAFFTPFLFDDTPLDASVTFRLARKAWSVKFQRERVAEIYDGKNFVEGQPNLEALRLMLRRFDEQARADGMVPVVLLFANKNYGDSLYRFFGPGLEEHGIPFVSSHEIAPTADPESFGPDRYHFSMEKRAEIAEEFLATVREEGVDLRALAAEHADFEADEDEDPEPPKAH